MAIFGKYWVKLALALSVVSTPFLILAIRKKISWRFFFSWTLTSVFATLTILFMKISMEKTLSERTRFYGSLLVGLAFAGIGIYLRSIKSENLKKIGLIFIVFAAIWTSLSF